MWHLPNRLFGFFIIPVALLYTCLFAVHLNALPKSESSDHGHEENSDFSSDNVLDAEAPYFSHIHGMHLADNGTVLVAAHDGLWSYNDDHWDHLELPYHDYMGFAPVADGFYASGHPDLSTDLPNPLGIVKVTDNGESLELIRFDGEIDFHRVAAGYFTNTIYLFNESPHIDLASGLHYSVDSGKSWIKIDSYKDGDPQQLAAHPSAAGNLALINENGLFLTENAGKTFTKIELDFTPSAIAFGSKNSVLYIGGTEALYSYDLKKRAVMLLPSPDISHDDSISNIAVSPGRPTHLAFATKNRIVFRSTDGGVNWQDLTLDESDTEHDESVEEESCDCG